MFFRRSNIALFLAGLLLLSASCSRRSASLATAGSEFTRKYPPEQLLKDYDAFREVMEKFHPSLYWYTSRDSMDMIFSVYRAAIRDSMTQQQFGFSVIAPVTTAIRCGHTSFSFSKKYNREMRGVRLPSFPLYLKVFGDSMIVSGNLNKKDSLLKRGTYITGIDGYRTSDLTRIMFRFMPADGYAMNMNYNRLSVAFPYYHRNIFGLRRNYSVEYIDSLGNPAITTVPVFEPMADSARKKADSLRMFQAAHKKPDRKERLEEIRSLRFIPPDDPIPEHRSIPGETAVMTLNGFDGKAGLTGFFKRSFRLMEQKNVRNLIIDIRANGGGKVNLYTELARYLRSTKFRVADTAFALRKGFAGYGDMFSMRTLNALSMGIFTQKKADGKYHFTYWENHYFKPKKKYFFKGHVYVLISGPSFSAATLFAHTVKGQSNVALVGEEAGGGHYGNNGLIIPNITLPHTGIRVRMPLFRLVQYQHPAKDGKGVLPDVYTRPTREALMKGVDLSLKKARELAATQARY